jgi:hypothetical protein
VSDPFINDPTAEEPDLDWREIMTNVLVQTIATITHVHRLQLGGEIQASILRNLEEVKLYCESILSILP